MHLSRPAQEALAVLAGSIRAERLRRGWSVTLLAERVGVTAQTITRIENGAPGVAVGTVFEAAHIVGVVLYGDEIGIAGRALERELPLLPKRGRTARAATDNDF